MSSNNVNTQVPVADVESVTNAPPKRKRKPKAKPEEKKADAVNVPVDVVPTPQGVKKTSKKGKKEGEEEKKATSEAVAPKKGKKAEDVAPESAEVKKPRKKRAKKDEADGSKPKTKKALTSYMYFTTQVREQLKKENPTLKVTELGQKMGAMWKSLSEEEKLKYKNEAAQVALNAAAATSVSQ